MTILTTSRLRLEPFADAHLEGLHRLNSDPRVMRYIADGVPQPLEETRTMIERVQARWADTGYSWWTLIERHSGRIVGAGCIQRLRRQAQPLPDPACPLEIGWRLRVDAWHQGLASEAAREMAAFAFERLAAGELYAVCHPENAASAAVMVRLGMEPLGLDTWYGRSLATYRISAAQWQERAACGAGPTPN